MGNRFRRALSALLLIGIGVAIYQFSATAGSQPGVAGLVLRQALWLFGLIVAMLVVAWYFRSR